MVVCFCIFQEIHCIVAVRCACVRYVGCILSPNSIVIYEASDTQALKTVIAILVFPASREETKPKHL